MSNMSYPTKENSQFMNVQGGEKKVMKKILSVALSTAMAFSMFASVAFGETAKATPEEAFNALAAKGILNGYPDGQAHLEKDLTRAEFAKIITKLFGLQEVTGQLSYKDKGYTATNWAVPYIEAVTKAGYMQGQDTVKGIFNYNGKVTVEEVAAVLARALKLEAPTATDNSASVWAKGYAQAVINAGFIAKDVNFKANAIRSLVVEAAYKVDAAQTKPAVVSAQATSPTKVLVTFADQGTLEVTLTTALVAGTETTIPTFQYKGFNYSDVKVTLAAPQVVSVTSANAKQLVVKFNRPVDASTLIATGDVFVTDLVEIKEVAGAKVVDETKAKVVLSDDKTTATVTAAAGEIFDGQYAITIKKGVKTSSAEEVPAFTVLLTIKDTVAPTLVSTTAVAKTTTNQVTVKFSEPVQTAGVIAYVNNAAVTIDPSKNAGITDTLVLTTGNLDSGKTYDVSLLNVKDYAGNATTPNPLATTVAVVSDVAGPVVKSVTVDGEKNVKVEFDKAVDKATFDNNVRLVNPSNGAVLTLFGTPVLSNGDKTVVFTPFDASQIAFGKDNTFTATFFLGTGVKDKLGNALASAYSTSLTFTKDVVAPTVTGVTYTSKGLLVTFSEGLTNVPLGNAYTVIDDATGLVKNPVVGGSAAVQASDDKTVLLPYSLGTGNYTLRLGAEFVTDKATVGNKNAATVNKFSVTAASTTDSSAPEFNWTDASKTYVVASANGTLSATQTISYVVYDANGLDFTTVLDVNNYTLDGKALPSGTWFTTNRVDNTAADSATNKTTVTLNIPASGLTETKDSYRLVISNIKDKAGNTAGPQVSQAVKLFEGTKPVFNSAVIASGDNTTVVLGFSETVRNVNVKDFDVIINGSTTAVPDASLNLVAGSGSDAGKYLLKVATEVKTIDSVKGLFVKGTNIRLTTLDSNASNADGWLNFNSSYVSSASITIASDAGIIDLADTATGNTIVKGTSIAVK
ncbi:Ig-like domain-containing protein [Paenibacillus tepidiphilus]|uniref:Ig-like domain-containing protein n=1 Tax=Paenibacillus tepidiphilus TaxID=2608683 RepID=UPI00123A79F3|nr:Ig-like domain-containing protein [Paenibacillus tepidiphilus]